MQDAGVVPVETGLRQLVGEGDLLLAGGLGAERGVVADELGLLDRRCASRFQLEFDWGFGIELGASDEFESRKYR